MTMLTRMTVPPILIGLPSVSVQRGLEKTSRVRAQNDFLLVVSHHQLDLSFQPAKVVVPDLEIVI